MSYNDNKSSQTSRANVQWKSLAISEAPCIYSFELVPLVTKQRTKRWRKLSYVRPSRLRGLFEKHPSSSQSFV